MRWLYIFREKLIKVEESGDLMIKPCKAYCILPNLNK